MISKSCGRNAACDLVLDHPTVSRVHASIERSTDGRVWVVDADSRNGIFLQRNGAWIRVRRVSLCTGDLIRMGEVEIPLERLTSVFAKHTDLRLGEKHFSLRSGNTPVRSMTGFTEPGPGLSNPKRNPLTGKIEEDQP